MLIKTYSPSNKFRFKCPIFGVETKIAECLNLRDRVWRGEKIEERRGCQACMSSSKCPIPRIVTQITRTGEDPYHSSEDRVGPLKPEILNDIAPIVVMDHFIHRYEVPPTELEFITQANANAGPGTRSTAPRKPIGSIKLDKVETETKTRAKVERADEAAVTGDMGAAIAKVAKREGEARPMVGLFATLSDEQKAKVLEHDGNINHGPAEPRVKSPERPVQAPQPAKAQSPQPTPPSPPASNVVKAKGSDLANSPRKVPSLLELARMKRAAS